MAWTWRYESAQGVAPAGDGPAASEGFPSQADAETWLGEHWRGLLDDGVAQVVLRDGEREVYGPMSLSPP